MNSRFNNTFPCHCERQSMDQRSIVLLYILDMYGSMLVFTSEWISVEHVRVIDMQEQSQVYCHMRRRLRELSSVTRISAPSLQGLEQLWRCHDIGMLKKVRLQPRRRVSSLLHERRTQ